MKNSSLSQGKMVTVISIVRKMKSHRRIDAEQIIENDIWEIFTDLYGQVLPIAIKAL